MALIRDGNTNAFEAVYDRHYRAILSFCRHMLGCADEAEDAVQHTFLAAYNDLVSSRKPICLRAWLFTIARNRCLSILRARRERTALEFEERATDGLAVQVQRRQDLRDLVVDINHLPDEQRAALVLAEMGALSHDEIASVLAVPKDKVKALIFQARESLLADRAARDADCHEIREQLATMRGAALRRTTLRRHLRGCQGCREYRHELERQRRRIAVILPVAPTIALRQAIVGVTAGGGLAGAGMAGGGLLGASSVLKGVAGKALIGALLAAAGTTGTLLAVHDFRLHVLDPRLSGVQPSLTTNVLGATAARLAPSSGIASARSAADGSTPAGAYAGSSSLMTTAAGHETPTAKAIVHALTGQLNNLLSPAWPHEKLLGSGGAHTPTSPPSGIAAPTPTPVTNPQPTASAPSAPVATAPTSGTPSGPYAGEPTAGGPGPSGASGSVPGSGSGDGSTATVTPPGASGSVPVAVPVSAPAGGGPVPIDGGTPGTGTGSDPGPGPTPTPAPAPSPAPSPDPGSPAGSGTAPGPGPGPTSGLSTPTATGLGSDPSTSTSTSTGSA
ncbi:MAG TPA: sigma-70 family RNA polymerase sigma factor [Solirubrobacteraceae bacterium]|nr:sigma-70 family RNA polymerase sigma factor [Solirubrobacteraceae bacterium]